MLKAFSCHDKYWARVLPDVKPIIKKKTVGVKDLGFLSTRTLIFGAQNIDRTLAKKTKKNKTQKTKTRTNQKAALSIDYATENQ